MCVHERQRQGVDQLPQDDVKGELNPFTCPSVPSFEFRLQISKHFYVQSKQYEKSEKFLLTRVVIFEKFNFGKGFYLDR